MNSFSRRMSETLPRGRPIGFLSSTLAPFEDGSSAATSGIEGGSDAAGGAFEGPAPFNSQLAQSHGAPILYLPQFPRAGLDRYA